MMLTDYFITPVSPTFFSLQAIDNLSTIFNNWIKLLGEYETTQSFKGLSFKPKFLGLVVQMAKRFNGGSVQETTKFSKSAEKAGVPIVHLTQDICTKYKDSRQMVDQSFISISNSYNKIADGLIKIR